ncbi:MAG: FCD domain-containing protein [Bacillota bacterium]
MVLTFLDQTTEPVGSGAVCEWLRHHGQLTSEATAGRFLRELDHRGLTQRLGFRGRCLTPLGQSRLAELRRERAVTASSSKLVDALRARDLDDLVEVLAARRALEREIARLAALHATDEDLAVLEVLVRHYETADPATVDGADFAIHERMAAMAGNKVLQAATRLIHDEAEAFPIPAALRRRLKPVLERQHRDLLEALRQRDADRAESVMIAHLDLLIESVQNHQRPRRR